MKKTLNQPLNKKLVVDRQTIRTLATMALEDVVAGVNPTSDTVYGQSCACHA